MRCTIILWQISFTELDTMISLYLNRPMIYEIRTQMFGNNILYKYGSINQKN